MRRLVLMVVAMLLVPAAASAHECWSDRILGPAGARAGAPTFEGRVLSVRFAPEDSPLIEVTFQVLRSWGDHIPTSAVLKTTPRHLCGVDFLVGEHYLVVPRFSDQGLFAGDGDVIVSAAPAAKRLKGLLGEPLGPLFLCGTGRLVDGESSGPTPYAHIPGLGDDVEFVDTDLALGLYSVLAALTLLGIGVALRIGDRRFGRGG